MSRRRSRGGRRVWTWLAALAVVVAVVAGAGTPTASFTTASADRSSNVDVVRDGDGVLTLDKAGNLTAGTDQRLVNVTNYVARPIDVTVTLKNETYGDISDDDETGDTVTFHLDQQAEQRVDVSLNCEPSVGTNVTFRIRVDEVGFEADLNRSVEVTETKCSVRHLVYTTPAESALRSRTPAGGTEQYNATTDVVGAHRADVDGDGREEIPYVPQSTSELRLIDATNETSGVLTDDVSGTPTHLWVGSWNGSSTAVFYVNSSNAAIYRVRPGQDPVLVADVKAGTVAGAGDIDGDGAAELVYTGTSQTVKYVDPDGSSHSTGVGVGKNNGVGVGEPADYDDNGTARVPIVDGSNNVYLVDAAGNKKQLVSGEAEKTFLAPFNWDDSDPQPEVTFVRHDTHDLNYVNDVRDTLSLIAIKKTDVGVDADAGTA